MFKDLDSEKLFDGKMIKVWRERVEHPDGRQVALEVIHHPGSVLILPVDNQGQVWFTYQYRHAIRQMLLELPAGTIEPGEQPLVCAGREIQEEVGMAAQSLELLGQIYLVPGYSNERMHVYLATDLYPSRLDQDFGEYIEVKTIHMAEAYKMLDAGEILDSKTAAVLGMARSRLSIID